MFTLCCFSQHNIFSAPLNIEINQGIDAVPHETGDVDKDITSSYVDVISAKEIRNTQLNINQIIRNVSAVQIREISGFGSLALASLRGKSTDQLIVYLDGVPLNDATGTGVDLSLISSNEIAAVEIYKDIVPINFSQASIGGLINIISQRKKVSRTSLGLTGGSYNTKGIKGFHSHDYNNWNVILSGDYLTSSNNYPYVSNNGTPHNIEDDITTSRKNNQFTRSNFSIKTSTQLLNQQTFIMQAEMLSKKQGLPTVLNSSTTNSSLSHTNWLTKFKWTKKQLFNTRLDVSADVSVQQKSLIFDDRQDDIGVGKDYKEYLSKTVQSGFFANYFFANNELITKLSLQNERFQDINLLDNRFSQSSNRMSLLTGLQSNSYFFKKRLILSPALRSNYTKDQLLNNSENKAANNYHHITPQFGLRAVLTDNLSLKTNIARYYRIPSFSELYGARGYIGASSDLQSEEGINGDFSLEYKRYFQSLLLTHLSWKGAIFVSKIDNEIVYISNGQDASIPTNIGNSEIIGWENQLVLEFNYDYLLTLNTTLQRPLATSNKNKLLPGRTPASVFARLLYDGVNLQVFSEIEWDSGFYYDPQELLYSQAKHIINAGVSNKFKKIKLSLEIQNINNASYRNYYFQPIAGRFITGNLEYTF